MIRRTVNHIDCENRDASLTRLSLSRSMSILGNPVFSSKGDSSNYHGVIGECRRQKLESVPLDRTFRNGS